MQIHVIYNNSTFVSLRRSLDKYNKTADKHKASFVLWDVNIIVAHFL